MDTNLITVSPADDQEEVAKIMADYNFVAIPVVVKEKMIGMITVDDIVDVIDEEAAEDYSRLAGVDVVNIEDNPIKSAVKRLPWLIGLIFLGMGTASVIDGYNYMVAETSVLAVFISLITGTAGNAGTQSLAVAVRRIAVRKQSTLKSLLFEILIGALIGVLAGVTIFLVIRFGKTTCCWASLLAWQWSCYFSVNVAGAFIPLIMKDWVHPAVDQDHYFNIVRFNIRFIYFNVAKIFIDHFMMH